MASGARQPSDAALVRRFRRGDDAAFEALYARHKDFAYRVAYGITGRHDDACDAVQEAFAWIARRRGSLTLRAKMTTLLYPVVRNASISINRRNRRLGPDGPLPLDALPAASDAAGADPELQPLLSAMGRLSPEHQEIILLRFVHGMSPADAAIALGVPAGTVRSRLHHALNRLRESPGMEGYFGDGVAG